MRTSLQNIYNVLSPGGGIGASTPRPKVNKLDPFRELTSFQNAYKGAPQGQVLGDFDQRGGGGTAPGGGNVYNQADLTPYLEPAPEQSGIDLDSMIAPALQAFDESIGATQSRYDADVAESEAVRAGAVARQQQFQAGEEQKAERQKQLQTETGERNVGEQRSALAEVLQGLQALYGGTTGTGRFVSELSSRDALKNVANIRQNVANAIAQIDDKLGQVREIVRISIDDAENKAVAMKQRAKAELDSALANIRQAKGELYARKAELAMQAMQFFQQRVDAINQRNAAFKQSIAQQALDAEQKLNSAKQQGSDYLVNFDLPPAVAQMVSGGKARATLSGRVPGGGRLNVQFGGATNEEDEDIFGGE